MEYLLLPAAYLIGAIPFGLVFGKLAGLDVRTAGSGNIGATNVARLAGKKLGLLALACDLLKGLLPMFLADHLLAASPDRQIFVALAGFSAFIGHLYPIYLRFQGGKGVATALGVFLYLSPLASLVALAVFVLVVANWGYVSLGSLSASLLMPGLIWLLDGSMLKTGLAFGVGALIWWKHRDNIGRLVRHEEKPWQRKE